MIESAPPDIVHWLSDGLSFRVENETALCEHVLPLHFAHRKMASFQRQLNIYGFRRFIKGEKAGAFYHPCFARGRADLLRGIEVRSWLDTVKSPPYLIHSRT